MTRASGRCPQSRASSSVARSSLDTRLSPGFSDLARRRTALFRGELFDAELPDGKGVEHLPRGEQHPVPTRARQQGRDLSRAKGVVQHNQHPFTPAQDAAVAAVPPVRGRRQLRPVYFEVSQQRHHGLGRGEGLVVVPPEIDEQGAAQKTALAERTIGDVQSQRGLARAPQAGDCADRLRLPSRGLRPESPSEVADLGIPPGERDRPAQQRADRSGFGLPDLLLPGDITVETGASEVEVVPHSPPPLARLPVSVSHLPGIPAHRHGCTRPPNVLAAGVNRPLLLPRRHLPRGRPGGGQNPAFEQIEPGTSLVPAREHLDPVHESPDGAGVPGHAKPGCDSREIHAYFAEWVTPGR